jgi:serine/threonine protein kinase
MMEGPLGPIYFSGSGCVYEVDPRAAAPGAYLLHAEPNTTLHELLAQQLDPAIFGDVVSFSNFAETLLTIDPDGRPAAAEALQHPWIASYSLPTIDPSIVPVASLPPIDPPFDPPIVPVAPASLDEVPLTAR